MNLRTLRGALCSAITMLAALALAPGLAAATTYFFTTGTATVTATAGATPVLSETIDLTGVFVEFDDTGDGTLVDFLITLGPSPVLTLDNAYGGFDEIVIESADLAPGVGFTNIFNQDQGGGLYSFLATPIDINGTYSAMDSNNVNPPVMNVDVPFVDNSNINGTVNTILGTMELTGITLTSLPAGLFPGETDDLVVKADLMFTGVIPEPTTGLLFGFGLASVAIARRRRII